MGINKYNSEGYYDPTVYEALSNIEKEEKAARRVYRPLVYICSPYAGDVERNEGKFAITMGSRYLIVREKFEEYIDSLINGESEAEPDEQTDS